MTQGTKEKGMVVQSIVANHHRFWLSIIEYCLLNSSITLFYWRMFHRNIIICKFARFELDVNFKLTSCALMNNPRATKKNVMFFFTKTKMGLFNGILSSLFRIKLCCNLCSDFPVQFLNYLFNLNASHAVIGLLIWVKSKGGAMNIKCKKESHKESFECSKIKLNASKRKKNPFFFSHQTHAELHDLWWEIIWKLTWNWSLGNL